MTQQNESSLLYVWTLQYRLATPTGCPFFSFSSLSLILLSLTRSDDQLVVVQSHFFFFFFFILNIHTMYNACYTFITTGKQWVSLLIQSGTYIHIESKKKTSAVCLYCIKMCHSHWRVRICRSTNTDYLKYFIWWRLTHQKKIDFFIYEQYIRRREKHR